MLRSNVRAHALSDRNNRRHFKTAILSYYASRTRDTGIFVRGYLNIIYCDSRRVPLSAKFFFSVLMWTYYIVYHNYLNHVK